jgi:hypothetical protein
MMLGDRARCEIYAVRGGGLPRECIRWLDRLGNRTLRLFYSGRLNLNSLALSSFLIVPVSDRAELRVRNCLTSSL